VTYNINIYLDITCFVFKLYFFVICNKFEHFTSQYSAAKCVMCGAYIMRLLLHELQTIAKDDSERLSVCLSRGFAVQTRLNGSRSCVK